MRCRPPAEHNFLIRSIKTLHVYSQIMTVVNKPMQPSTSHGINVNKKGGGDGGEVEGQTATEQRNNLKTTEISHGDFPN